MGPLAPPAIGQEPRNAARATGEASMWGFVDRGRAHEGLTCVGLEWIDSFGGGPIVAADGATTVDGPRAAAVDLVRHRTSPDEPRRHASAGASLQTGQSWPPGSLSAWPTSVVPGPVPF